MPKVPPRPTHRRIDRSPSTERYARSPLNETPYLGNHGNLSKPHLGDNDQSDANRSSTDAPRRPPSVTLPSIGQEGIEYADISTPPEELGETRNIANDLKLHAPKPSLPKSSAKERVSAVTRTDSDQAASFGIGKASSGSDEREHKEKKAKASVASQNSNGIERPPSSLESDHGIPEIGQRVPMYPNAGDVQAPSPAPSQTPYAPGIGFHNDGSKPRHHTRKTSAREHEVPLEAYGRHGHQVLLHDRFEKAYYEKHPELYKKEVGQYGEGRQTWAMSSEDLNKIVRDTASRGSGLGTSSTSIGTPSEQVGFQATEEYTSRVSSPRPQSGGFQFAHSNTSQTHAESPLAQTSFPADAMDKPGAEHSLSRSLDAPSDNALESEREDDDVIHVDIARPTSRIYGGDVPESTESLGVVEETDNEEYGAPILASDEVAKEPLGYELQPAVSPLTERRSSQDYSFYQNFSASQTSLSGSRPTSRPGSIHGVIPEFRVGSTKLEDLEEYEPLFPEDETNAGNQKPLTAADKLKRPEHRKFPSRDIWEDTPNSLQYTATVSLEQLPEEVQAAPEEPKETPEQAWARRQEELAESESSGTESFLNQEKKKPWAGQAHLVAETRPGLKQRFPSRDIWEDTPDSLQYTATVAAPQPQKEDESLPDDGSAASVTAYHEEMATSGLPLGSETGRAIPGTMASQKPQIPARPVKSSKLAQSPEKTQPAKPGRPAKKVSLPDSSSKPVVPARPSKSISQPSSENVPLAQVASNSSAKSIDSDQGTAAVAKVKPPVPSRPVGSKIAALQGGFMADLNKRLQLGPKKEEVVSPPEAPEEVKEKAPLSDARKGRARGPARRAPAKSPSPATTIAADSTDKAAVLGISIPSMVWQIDPDEDEVSVTSMKSQFTGSSSSLSQSAETKAEKSETPTLAANVAGESLHETSDTAPGADKAVSPLSAAQDAHTEKVEESQKLAILEESRDSNDETEPMKTSDEPPVAFGSTLSPDASGGKEVPGAFPEEAEGRRVE